MPSRVAPRAPHGGRRLCKPAWEAHAVPHLANLSEAVKPHYEKMAEATKPGREIVVEVGEAEVSPRGVAAWEATSEGTQAAAPRGCTRRSGRAASRRWARSSGGSLGVCRMICGGRVTTPNRRLRLEAKEARG